MKDMQDETGPVSPERVAPSRLVVGGPGKTVKNGTRLTASDCAALANLLKKAQDDLFEIDIAYRLFRRGMEVEFAEPDIVIRLPEGLFSVACKRPRTIEAVQGRIRDGANQIRKLGLPDEPRE